MLLLGKGLDNKVLVRPDYKGPEWLNNTDTQYEQEKKNKNIYNDDIWLQKRVAWQSERWRRKKSVSTGSGL